MLRLQSSIHSMKMTTFDLQTQIAALRINTQGRRARAPLELWIYRVNILKIRKISFFLLFGPPRQNLFRRPWA